MLTLEGYGIRPLDLISDCEDQPFNQRNNNLSVKSVRAKIILSPGCIHLMSVSQDQRQVPQRLHLDASPPCVLAMLYLNQTSGVDAYCWLAIHWEQRPCHHSN